MMPDTPHPTEKAVSTRDIAQRAGVSNATVSLALRFHPRISAQTRARVQRAAEELGYRPDPQIAKLMYRLRLQRKPGFQSTIAALTTIPEDRENRYSRDIRTAAEARANALGYAFMVMRLPDADIQRAAIQRILVSRGVEGVLLLPMLHPRSIADWLDWSQFSVVTATYGVLAPEFHRVVPHQFGNTLTMCEALSRIGYRRLGLVLPAQHDLTVHHGFSAAVAWQGMLGGTELVHPLIYASALTAAALRTWFKRERPDVIIAPGEADCREIAAHLNLTIPGHVGFAVGNRLDGSTLAGIDERPSAIGTAAVDLLHTTMLAGGQGIPTVPTIAMVPGCWVAAPSVLCEARHCVGEAPAVVND